MLFPSMSPDRADRGDLVRVDGRSISTSQLTECAAAVADELLGVERVAIEAAPALETVVGVVGALRAGAAVVPIAPDTAPAERLRMLRDAGVQAVLAPGARPEWPGPLPVIPVDLRRRSAASHAEPDPERPALILYTSGTTGPAKGAVISRRAVAACLDGLAQAWNWSPEDLLVHGLPLFHVHGLVLGVLGPLRVGGRLDHVGRPRTERYAAARGSLYFGVPTVWSRMRQDPPSARALAGARLLVSGSAPLPRPVFDDMHALSGHRIVERYGMTETLITISGRCGELPVPGQVGRPLPGVQTRLVDERGAPVPADGSSLGELLVRGSTMFSGYLGRPDAESTDADGWFRTGDIAAVGADGSHRIIGRSSSDLIKTGGYKVGAGEVEDALLAHARVAEAAVVGVPDADLGQRITAYVVAEGVTEAELIDFVTAGLSAHKRPRQVRFVTALPRNALGKVQKSLLAE